MPLFSSFFFPHFLLSTKPSAPPHAHLPNPPPPSLLDHVIIVGAGPSGLATAALLRSRAIPFLLLERSSSIASLWKERTYDRLKMHIAKVYCKLPMLDMPESWPTFITRDQFLTYLDEYVERFEIRPRFCETVTRASFEDGVWNVETEVGHDEFEEGEEKGEDQQHARTRTENNEENFRDMDMLSRSSRRRTYQGRWLVIATGENAEMVIPQIPGLDTYTGRVLHSAHYKNGTLYTGQKVLVVGSGNSGMEIALDLANAGAKPYIVVRSPMHVLPLQVMGKSTFSVVQKMMKLGLSMQLIDRFLVAYAHLILGNTSAVGIQRPCLGPITLKVKFGKTPVLDVGTIARIHAGHIKVRSAVKCIYETGVRYVDGTCEEFDGIIFATGYRSNALDFLKDNIGATQSGTTSWKSQREGLYVAGMSRNGIFGATADAELIAADIHDAYVKRLNGTRGISVAGDLQFKR